jgi:hypothetical protein
MCPLTVLTGVQPGCSVVVVVGGTVEVVVVEEELVVGAVILGADEPEVQPASEAPVRMATTASDAGAPRRRWRAQGIVVRSRLVGRWGADIAGQHRVCRN